jgi:hypothetical protein
MLRSGSDTTRGTHRACLERRTRISYTLPCRPSTLRGFKACPFEGEVPKRIAQIAPLQEAVPPKIYGGTERVVSYLTEALVDLGTT